MGDRLREFFISYGLPLLSVSVAIGATLLLSQVTREARSSAVFFLGAIMVSTWYAGRPGGFLAIALSVVSIDFLFLKPFAAYSITVYDLPLVVVFSALAVIITYLVDFRRRSEKQLRQTNAQLEQMVADRTRELAEANRAKDEALAMVAHDLRAPLTSILGWIEIIEQDGIEDDSVSQALAVIKRNAVAEKHLVTGLLDFSGIAADGFKLNLQSVDLMGLLGSTRERFEPMAAQKKVKLEFKTSEALPPIEADSHRLFRVFDNLLSNAIKFTPGGGRVDVRARPVGRNVHIAISDTGPGIDPTLLPYIFDPFRRGTATDPESWGLGLSIVKQIVEAHGGSVSVSAGKENGKGATFTVMLPSDDWDELTRIQQG
ncbi:MAG TPA: HAMP domain-containing sensor histidine kinase [Pyrinomonadaceae bacterium]